MSYHTLIIIGALGRDPEIRYTPSGQAVTSFSVAASEQYTNAQGEKVKRINWFRVSAWGKLAEICNEYLKKGSKVFVEGQLTADEQGNPKTYAKKDGSAGANYDVRAVTVKFLSPAPTSVSAARDFGGEVGELPVEDDQIPF